MPSSIESSARRSRRIWVSLSKICSSFTLCSLSLEESSTSNVFVDIEFPMTRALRRARSVRAREAQAFVQAGHDAVLLARNVEGAYRPNAAPLRRLDRD